MKKIATVFISLLLFTGARAQKQWFSIYQDTAALVTDANTIIQEMAVQVYRLNPALDLRKHKAIKNTTPFLIYIDSLTVNIPFWTEVIPPQKDFFAEVAGGEKEGKEVFGLFFNGFYIAHELGHAISSIVGKKFPDEYASEYEANTIGILYWRNAGKQAQLEKCYQYARKMLTHLKNPVPAGEDARKYITAHYYELAADPYKYGYIQFSQFVEIYEDRSLPDFKKMISQLHK